MPSSATYAETENSFFIRAVNKIRCLDGSRISVSWNRDTACSAAKCLDCFYVGNSIKRKRSVKERLVGYQLCAGIPDGKIDPVQQFKPLQRVQISPAVHYGGVLFIPAVIEKDAFCRVGPEKASVKYK